MAIYSELRGFVLAQRSCAVLRGDSDRETTNGYRLWVTCACGAHFEWWVTPEDAERNLLRSELLAFES